MIMMKAALVLGTMLFLGARGGALFGQGLEFSGVLDSTAAFSLALGGSRSFDSYYEEYANLRMTAKLREGAAFYGALNLIASAGSSALSASSGASPSSVMIRENYTAAMELERLYFRIQGDSLDFDGGLMRIAFGYGQVFGPSDFLNPKNPLVPDARKRAVLGGALSVYPLDSLKLRLFGTAPKNPVFPEAGGGLAGIAGDWHGERLSVQALYAYEALKDRFPAGIHRWGLSLKADLVVGLVADMLYTYDREAEAVDEGRAFTNGPAFINGLAFSGGLDYSFLEGEFYVLAEYLYNGASSSTSADGGNLTGLSGDHFLYTGITWRFRDDTGLTLACLSGLGDPSFTPVLSTEHELFQGLTLSLSAQAPLDRELFSVGGPEKAGNRFLLTAKARLRF